MPRRRPSIAQRVDRRVTRLAAYYPALSDMTGYVNGRPGGWPHMFRATDGPNVHRDELYSWGFNDETCPPTSMYAACNVVTAPKRLMLAYDTGHRTTQEQTDDVTAWLADELAARKSGTGR